MQKFEWDPSKDKINQKKHDIGFKLASKVFCDKNVVVYPDFEHSQYEVRYIAIGRVSVCVVHSKTWRYYSYNFRKKSDCN